jgi:hypothetical protein
LGTRFLGTHFGIYILVLSILTRGRTYFFQTKLSTKQLTFSISILFVESGPKLRFLFWKSKAAEMLGLVITVGCIAAIFLLDRRFIVAVPSWIYSGKVPFDVFPTDATCR